MTNLLPFLLSLILPGAGQLYLKKIWKGLLMIALSLIPWLVIPVWPFQFIYTIVLIWSVADVYLTLEKTEGKAKSIRRLVFSIIIVVILIPVVVYSSILGLTKGGAFVADKYLKEGHTQDEMKEIETALEKYFNHYKVYPENYIDFVNKKPIWSHWQNDQWGNRYRYTNPDSITYKLVSAGEDKAYSTEDDIIIQSEN